MITARILWCALSTLILSILKFFFLDIPGAFFIWRALKSGSYEKRPSPLFPERELLLFTSKWMFLWNNYEDGIDGLRGFDPSQKWWLDQTATWSFFKRAFVWSALRNKTDNLQFSWLCPPPNPESIEWVYLNNGGQVVWEGWRHYVWTPLPKWLPFFEAVSFGFDRHPEDAHELPLGDIRRFGAGLGGRFTKRGA